MKPADAAAARRFCMSLFPEARRGFDFAAWLARRPHNRRQSLGFLAKRKGRIVGIVFCSVVALDFLNRPSRRHGRFELIAVAPGSRRRGIAMALWRQMEARLRRMGVRAVTTMSRSLSYGVDVIKYPATIVLLLRLGFEKKQDIYDQEADLRGMDFDTAQDEARLRRDGIELRLAEFSDRTALQKFLKGRFPQWLEVPSSMKPKSERNIHLALKGREIIAFSASYGRGFGPIGVNPRYRWKGLGKVLLIRCLKDIRRRGYKKVFIGWANFPFYAKAISAPITRVLWQMEKKLSQGARR